MLLLDSYWSTDKVINFELFLNQTKGAHVNAVSYISRNGAQKNHMPIHIIDIISPQTLLNR